MNFESSFGKPQKKYFVNGRAIKTIRDPAIEEKNNFFELFISFNLLSSRGGGVTVMARPLIKDFLRPLCWGFLGLNRFTFTLINRPTPRNQGAYFLLQIFFFYLYELPKYWNCGNRETEVYRENLMGPVTTSRTHQHTPIQSDN